MSTVQDVRNRGGEILSDPMVALIAVMEQYPSLHIGGMGMTRDFSFGPTADNRRRPAECIEGFRQAVTWCARNAIPVRHIVRSNRYHPITSYGQKHVMEKETGIYVENGVYIAAMLALGFRATDDYNPYFNAHLSHGGGVRL